MQNADVLGVFTGGQGPHHAGVCSTWLKGLKRGEVIPCYIRQWVLKFFFFWLGPRLEPTNTAQVLNPFFIYSSAQSFHLPTDGSVPVIMIGNGTGIAPFRSFWQQRMFDLNNRCPPESSKTGRRQWGDMLLFFGCRNSHLDDIYRHETDKAKQSRAITAVATAYSRQQGRPKVYTI